MYERVQVPKILRPFPRITCECVKTNSEFRRLAFYLFKMYSRLHNNGMRNNFNKWMNVTKALWPCLFLGNCEFSQKHRLLTRRLELYIFWHTTIDGLLFFKWNIPSWKYCRIWKSSRCHRNWEIELCNMHSNFTLGSRTGYLKHWKNVYN